MGEESEGRYSIVGEESEGMYRIVGEVREGRRGRGGGRGATAGAPLMQSA